MRLADAQSPPPGDNARMILSRPVAALAAFATFLLAPAAMAYEQPGYDVVRVMDGFEVRRYAPYWVAETEAAGGFDEARSAAFRRLFAYITGANAPRSTIDMTAPVVSREMGEKIEMTVPVVTRAAPGEGRHLMQFVLPARFTAETAPAPTDPEVRVRKVDGGWVAARTYSGRSHQRGYQENEAALLRLVAEAGLTVAGPPRFAVYNSPFTPGFLRRNEVLVPLAGPPS